MVSEYGVYSFNYINTILCIFTVQQFLNGNFVTITSPPFGAYMNCDLKHRSPTLGRQHACCAYS